MRQGKIKKYLSRAIAVLLAVSMIAGVGNTVPGRLAEAKQKSVQKKNKQNKTVTLKWGNTLNWSQMGKQNFRFPFSCQEGEYYISVSYVPTKKSDADIMAAIKIDGKYPQKTFESVKFPRSWVAESKNYFDKNGNEYASYVIQQEKELKESVRDSEALYSTPLQVSLKKGKHTLELDYLSGSMKIKEIQLIPVTKCKRYAEYKKEHSGKIYTGKTITVEGENVSTRSDRTIPCYSHNDAAMSPSDPGKTRINAFGGSYWYQGNSYGIWKIKVPEDGFYKLSMRVIQNNSGLSSARQISIDGEVPFKEFECYSFAYQSGFRTEVLGGKKNPYLIWLTKGTHTLKIQSVASHVRKPIQRLRNLGTDLSELVHDIQVITGTSPDPNFDYELDKKMPDLVATLKKKAEEADSIANEIEKISGNTPVITSTLHSDADVLRSLAKKVRTIPENISLISTIQGDLNDAASTLTSQPLGIDWISFQAPKERAKEVKASWIDTVKLMAVNLVESFKKEDTNKTKEKKQTINLWVARDKEWGNLLQQMIHEDFEAKTGVKVNVNVLPSGNTTVVSGASPLLLSVVAGNTPDIALGCDSKTPVELAIRGQLADLKQFADFKKVKKRFPKTTEDVLSYAGGCYGVPETMDFPVMVYRTDILEQNHISVPQTWDEIWQYTLPQLAQIDGNFYMGSSSMDTYASFLYQNGGRFYNKDGTCALNSEAAITSFEEWTKCFVQYNVPQSANFYNEMKKGTLPIGICSLSEYMELLSYAGELTGKLKIVPIPGIKDKNGTIKRYGAGSVTSAVMFKKSKNKEACWEFLKWWTSEKVQSRFAQGIEARVGMTGRWFSANQSAFRKLSWSNEELKVMDQWLPWYQNVPNVLGGYYSSRSITNAWTRTVMSGTDARDSIEQSYEEISKQIERKKQEYGKETQ